MQPPAPCWQCCGPSQPNLGNVDVQEISLLNLNTVSFLDKTPNLSEYLEKKKKGVG